ncbi:copper resistance system multicopper oxidase, partial [Bradyrhizobium sp. BRP05]|nr:copper resistance system multicopper oxidase [Bradyrhizobium sp. BRP05]
MKIPVHLFNGRPPSDPDTFSSTPGNRIRLRLINAAGDTAYRVGIPGQELTITHTDGFPVQPRQADAVVLGMGERLDVLITLGDQAVPVLALP